MILVGLEPTIPSSVGRCLIHWATGPRDTKGHIALLNTKLEPEDLLDSDCPPCQESWDAVWVCLNHVPQFRVSSFGLRLFASFAPKTYIQPPWGTRFERRIFHRFHLAMYIKVTHPFTTQSVHATAGLKATASVKT